jgi:hypothetical protein
MTTTLKRHPADVTADRLIKHYEDYFDDLAASTRDAYGIVIESLRYIADPYEAD